ncbi:hypothetical protein C0J52_05673 [Blattella germanica]|nr:hypothetical protein C0J52_05673 [Blattella germanica]
MNVVQLLIVPHTVRSRHLRLLQSLLTSSAGGREMHAIKKGLLWQQRDRIFSRWKERYFILTRDYLHCFKRSSGSGADKISEMGQFIFKVKLVEVERVEWINKKNYSTVALVLGRDGRVLLRAADGLEDWFELLEECMLSSKERRRALRSSHDPSWQRGDTHNINSINSSLEEWLLARHKIAGLQHLSDSVPDLPLLKRQDQERPESRMPDDEEEDEVDEEQWLRRRPPNHEQRLSLLTDIDINGCDMQMETPPPSVPATFRGRPTSYRLNSDVFFMSAAVPNTNEPADRLRSATPSFCSSRSVLTPVGSFRSTHLFNPSKVAADRYSVLGENSQLTRYRGMALNPSCLSFPQRRPQVGPPQLEDESRGDKTNKLRSPCDSSLTENRRMQ